MVKNNQKINQLGHNQRTILNTTINDNEKLRMNNNKKCSDGTQQSIKLCRT